MHFINLEIFTFFQVQLRSNEVSSAKTESQAEVKEYSKNEQQTPTKSVVTRKVPGSSEIFRCSNR